MTYQAVRTFVELTGDWASPSLQNQTTPYFHMSIGRVSMEDFTEEHPSLYAPIAGEMDAAFHPSCEPIMDFNDAQNLRTPADLIRHGLLFDPSDKHPDTSLENMHRDPDSRSHAPCGKAPQMTTRDGGGEEFRYAVSLRDTVAIVTYPREVPIAYLNKGQTYNLTVFDSNAPRLSTNSIQYRTSVRISFEEEEQRSNPAACWRIWQETRGFNQARRHDSTPLAVEYLGSRQQSVENGMNGLIKVQKTSLDGFCITWSANSTSGISECTVSLRFNFLSTDFSRSKGVKGSPVRFCVKTEMLPSKTSSEMVSGPEVCYCRVKLFRDHGAERKLSNDIAHVQKKIKKLQQQILQVQTDSILKSLNHKKRPLKAPKGKRAWSMCAHDEQSQKIGSGDISSLRNLQAELAAMQSTFFPFRKFVSILALRGDEKDDPDLYPAPSASSGNLRAEQLDGLKIFDLGAESAVVPQSETTSIYSHLRNLCHDLKRPKYSTVIRKISAGDANLPSDFLTAINVDPAYRPPATLHPRSKNDTCFYIRFTGDYKHPRDCYRAIYLTERTFQALTESILRLNRIEPANIICSLQSTSGGPWIMVDDEVVREIPEGQDMTAHIHETVGNELSNGSSAVEIKLRF